MSAAQLASLLEFVQAEGRICPLPPDWDTLYQMLPAKVRKGAGWEPSAPLILGGWDSPPLFKMLRLKEHIEYAAANGLLSEIDAFLRGLAADHWYYGAR